MTPTQTDADDGPTLSGIAFDSIDHFSPDGRLKDFDEVDQSAMLTLDTLRRLADEAEDDTTDDDPDGSKYLADTMADGGDDETRAERALKDVVAIEELAPGMCRVVSWSDAHDVDMRAGGCNCPDKQYNLDGGMHCKHELAAMLYARDDIPGVSMDDNLGGRTLVADGGQDIIHESGDSHTDWRLQVRDGHLEAAKQVPYDGTQRFTTEERGYVSVRKNSVFNADPSEVIDFYESKTDAEITTCKMCSWPVGSRPNSGHSFRDNKYCSAQCEVKHEHIKADARDARRAEQEAHQ